MVFLVDKNNTKPPVHTLRRFMCKTVPFTFYVEIVPIILEHNLFEEKRLTKSERIKFATF